jgi:hypothetical protein
LKDKIAANHVTATVRACKIASATFDEPRHSADANQDR